jgi:hypothetical protein
MAVGKTVKDVWVQLKGDASGLITAIGAAELSIAGLATATKAAFTTVWAYVNTLTGGILVAVAAAAALGTAITHSAKASLEENDVAQRTAALLAKNGQAYKDVASALDITFKKQERLTSYNDTEVQSSWNTLYAAVGNMAEAHALNNIAMDMAYTYDMDLASASKLLSNAVNGKTATLEKYGIEISSTASQQEILQAILEQAPEKFASAEDAVNSYAFQSASLKNQISNLVEYFGSYFAPMILDGIKKINAWGEAGGWQYLKAAIDKIVGGMKAVVLIMKTVYFVNTLSTNAFIALSYSIFSATQAMMGNMETSEAYAKTSKEALDKITNGWAGLEDTYTDMVNTMKGYGPTLIDTEAAIADASNDSTETQLSNLEKLKEAYGDKSIEKQRQEYYNSMGVYVSSKGELLTGPEGASGTVATEMTKSVGKDDEGKDIMKTFGVGRGAEEVMAEIYAKQEETKSTVGAKSDNGKVVIDSSEPVVVDTGFWSEGDGKNSKDLIETIQSIDHWVEKMANRPTASHFNIAASSTP